MSNAVTRNLFRGGSLQNSLKECIKLSVSDWSRQIAEWGRGGGVGSEEGCSITIIIFNFFIPLGVKIPRLKSKVKSKRKAEVVTPYYYYYLFTMPHAANTCYNKNTEKEKTS